MEIDLCQSGEIRIQLELNKTQHLENKTSKVDEILETIFEISPDQIAEDDDSLIIEIFELLLYIFDALSKIEDHYEGKTKIGEEEEDIMKAIKTHFKTKQKF